MDIRHLRYFIAVAETLHFGRAAEQLCMSQPPLSARIKEFEDQLGSTLFIRNTRNVRLTAEAQLLLPKARQIVNDFDDLMATFGRHDRSLPRRISLGVPSDTDDRALVEIRELFRREGIEIETLELTTVDQIAALRSGNLVLGAIRLPSPIKDLVVGRTLHRTLGAVLPKGHPLARKRNLTIADLAGEDLIIFPRSMAPDLYDHQVAIFAASGWRPRHVTHATRLARPLVINGEGVLFREKSYVDGISDLRWCSIVGNPIKWQATIAAAAKNADVHARYAPLLEDLMVLLDNWTLEESSSA
jgi:DNA-binding transcriptional LysR family regulator